MAKTRRKFTPEFEREAVALPESSGRPQMQIAAELGIQPLMLRQWRSALMGGSPPPRTAGASGAVPAGPVASPSDQTAEIARLRHELDRTRMERDDLKKRSTSSRRCPSDVRFHRAACEHLAGASHVPRARSLPQRLMRLAIPSRERPIGSQPSALARRSPNPRRASQALRLASGACCPSRTGSNGQSRASGASDAPSWHSGLGRASIPALHHRRYDLSIALNLLKQRFWAALRNTVWLADITDLPTGEGCLYLTAVLDLVTRKIVGWSMREHIRTELTWAALMMATQRQRPAAGLICHSDRGNQLEFKRSSQHHLARRPAQRRAPLPASSSSASCAVGC